MHIHNLEYIYATGGNQVTSINDSAQNPTGYEGGGATIEYNLNGSMTSMPDKGISSIKYNFLDLPNNMMINKNGNENIIINTRYRADGTKLRKENTTDVTGINGSITTVNITDYLDGFQYFHSGTLIPIGIELLSRRAMEPQAFSIIDPIDPTIDPPFGGGGIIVDVKTPDLQFFPTAEGFYDYQKNQYIYQYEDQLGNVRLSFARNSVGALEITDSNDYYPFGMNHLKTGNAYFGQGSYKSYKYNGKELQETGQYDYGMRMYMADLGRWAVVDELSEKSRRFSPYTYALDNPIMFVDPDGREAQGCCGNLWNLTKTYYSGMYQGAKGVVTEGYHGVKQIVTNPGGTAKSIYNNPGGILKAGINKGVGAVVGVVAAPAIARASLQSGDGTVAGKMAGRTLAEIGILAGTEGAGSAIKGTITAARTARTMSKLSTEVNTTAAEMFSAGKAPAAVVGAELNGKTAIGVSGAPPSTIAPQLEGIVNELGGIGTRTASGNPVGCCAEFNAGNELLLNNPSATRSQVNLTDAIRPRTGKVVPMCDNCKATFGK